MEKGEMTEEQAMMEKIVRVGFIRKVYGILSFQLLLTVGMGATMMNVDSVREFAVTNHWYVRCTPLLTAPADCPFPGS
jgi:FtsH-binding integral membrane protein